MQQFLGAPRAIVADLLNAIAQLMPLRMSAPDSGMRIVLQAEPDATKVAVLSGGGSGHEPAHAGFVGLGMLTGAIAGDLFASPGVEAVLAAIHACRQAPGVLLVIKNYTGDRLNFGLAAERARAEGIDVATVLVRDDIALPDAAQPRGLAGTVLVHKYVGHLAAQGVALAQIAERGQAFADRLLSLGMALSSATVPGQHQGKRSPELGLGIHNEPGARKVDPQSLQDALDLVLLPLLEAADARLGADAPLVVLLNDLGGCSTQELGSLANGVIARVGLERIAVMVRPAALMTSMDMHGFSITLGPADADVLEALRAPVETLAWPGVLTPRPLTYFEPERPQSEHAPGGGHRDARRANALKQAAQTLLTAKEELDALDAKVGDGDAGSTFAQGAAAVLAALEADALSTGEQARLAQELAALIEHSMGGSSGVLLSIMLTAATQALAEAASWPDALERGIARMQETGGARQGDRTMLDALIPAIAALREQLGDLQAAATAAREGATATATMQKAQAGRSASVRAEALAGVVDPGAEAVARAFEAFAQAATSARST
ncbi:dihydroxyacetone kinase subunit DhaK [Pseudoxanthomonas winnipegensis]|uniref:dihydroxyacetone kinase subunit DhaK n=1 Tax=Pseudoxanthomonas winnipegensis TaxID=2480810 RepID=UPI00103AFA1A|nr:dihydroxyacetone kinase subunit DhaK [Pseudoxanthomonas winnipegensis]TBV74379.1 DAK2 domain-containing protein [Pseudoxanthomonas winnipegensis]